LYLTTRSIVVIFDAAGGVRDTTATLIDWSPVRLLLNVAGGKTLLSWDRLVLCELVEDIV
jgi:hypothetical protein